MTVKAVGDVLRDSAALFEEAAKMIEMFREAMIALAPQTDIEIIPLAEAPAISLQVLAKIELRRVSAHPAPTALRRTQLEFDFFRRNGGFACPDFRAGEMRDRAEM